MIKEIGDLEILDAHWITQGNIPQTLGIIITKNRAGKIKARAGTGLGARGSNDGEGRDIERIAIWGGRLHAMTAVQIVKSLIEDVTIDQIESLLRKKLVWLKDQKKNIEEMEKKTKSFASCLNK